MADGLAQSNLWCPKARFGVPRTSLRATAITEYHEAPDGCHPAHSIAPLQTYAACMVGQNPPRSTARSHPQVSEKPGATSERLRSARLVSATLSIVALAGCGGTHSLSGTYVAKDAGDGAAMLQLTEDQSQHLMGSMIVVNLQSNGVLAQHLASITGGSTDGTSFTITVKPNEPLSQSVNFGGRVARRGVDLTMGTVTGHFSPASPQDFDAAVSELAAAGKEQQSRHAAAQALANDTHTVAQLTQDLNSYSAKVEAHSPSSKSIHDEEEKILAAARHDLTLERGLNPQSFQARQVRFRIGQLAFQLGQIKFQVGQAIPASRDHIRGFDARLAANPLQRNGKSSRMRCVGRRSPAFRVRAHRVLDDAKQVEADVQRSTAEMTALNKEAGN